MTDSKFQAALTAVNAWLESDTDDADLVLEEHATTIREALVRAGQSPDTEREAVNPWQPTETAHDQEGLFALQYPSGQRAVRYTHNVKASIASHQRISDKVLGWMPLPEAPEQGRRGRDD